MNGHADIDPFVATEHLKNILNVGKDDADSGKIKEASIEALEASGDAVSSVHEGSYQKVELNINKDSEDVAIYGVETDIFSSPLEHGTICSQVMVENMVDYGWEERYHYGKLVNIHLSGLYLAYVLKPPNNKPGFVRIVRTSLNLRHLIKDYKSEVKDIAFAHTTSQVLLGSVDACGEFIIHKITDDGSSILCNLVIRVLRPADWLPSEFNRIIWCLYIPDINDNEEADSTAEDISSLLVVTHNEKAEVWNIDTIIKKYGHGNLTVDEARHGVQIINDHKMPITAAIFSPDGTALAIASLDGVINFFQVNFTDSVITPRCLHKWIPHKEKPLSSFYFLDNHKNHRPEDQFWKYAITGAENNSEIKLWSCESWNCLQTIRIHPSSKDTVKPSLISEMDYSSKFLLLSDIKRKVILVFLIHQDQISGNPMICALSEYKIPLPVLSLIVSNVHHTKSNSLSEERNTDDEDTGDAGQISNICEKEEHTKFVLKLFWIQTKALQSCKIYFQPKVNSLLSAESVSSLSQESYVYKDGLSDISLDIRDTSSRSSKELDISLQKTLCVVDDGSSSTALTSLPTHIPTYSNCSEVLLTPDDFTSPSHSNLTTSAKFSHHEEMNSASKCEPISHLSDGIDALPVEPATLIRRKSSQHSATSSPSREVAEILGPMKLLNIEGISNDNPITESNDVETISNGLETYNNLTETGHTINQQEFNVKDWPQAPDTSTTCRISTIKENDLMGPNHFQADSSESSNSSMELNSKLLKFGHSMDDILQKMNSLSDVVRDQRCDIQTLQTQIKMFREEQIQTRQSSNENALSAELENYLSQTIASQYNRLEKLVSARTEEECRKIEKELSTLSIDMTASLENKLDVVFKKELSHNLVPQFHKVIENIMQNVQSDFNQKLIQTDSSLKENFTKLLKGKPFMDNIASNLTSALQNIVHTSCKDIFQNSVVPSFEKAVQNLFQQLNDSYSKGINEYFQVIEKCTQQSCAVLENATGSFKEDIKKLVSEAQQAIRAQTLQTEAHRTDMIKQHDALLMSIRQVVQEETRKILREQQTAVLNSRATTPVPFSDPHLTKQHLLQLVRQGNFNDAFQTALSAMDVQLVIYLCESVNCDQVFGTIPCPLQQHVLLSLVNQLSADLNVKTEIKVRYIEEVIACLDCNDPIIRDHIRAVIESLQTRISNFLARNPTHKLARSLRRISLAINSFIK